MKEKEEILLFGEVVKEERKQKKSRNWEKKVNVKKKKKLA